MFIKCLKKIEYLKKKKICIYIYIFKSYNQNKTIIKLITESKINKKKKLIVEYNKISFLNLSVQLNLHA